MSGGETKEEFGCMSVYQVLRSINITKKGHGAIIGHYVIPVREAERGLFSLA